MIRNTTITNCRQTHGTARKSHTTIMRHQENKLSNVQQKIEQLQTPTSGVTINSDTVGPSNKQQNHRFRTDISLSNRGGGGLNAFYWYQIFALDSALVEVQEVQSLKAPIFGIPRCVVRSLYDIKRS